jgi:hypothetical protein
VKAALATREPEDKREVLIGSSDEGRFGCINRLRSCWAPEGVRPVVPSKIIRQFVYVFVAVFARIGKLVSLILPYTNTEMMELFLEEVSKQLKDYFLIMVVDRASWHQSKKLKVPENIRLIALPKGSPELNPSEHIFEDIREKDTPNMYFSSIPPLVDQLSSGLNRLSSNPKYLTSLTDFPYTNVTL